MKIKLILIAVTLSLLTHCQETKEDLSSSNMDFSGVEGFYNLVDELKAGHEPASSWDSLFKTGYYAFYKNWNQDKFIKKYIEIAFLPSRSETYDSLLGLNNYYGIILKHLRAADSLRNSIAKYQDSLSGSDMIETAKERAAEWLPAGILDTIKLNPKVNFGIFQPDGNADKEVAIDVLHAMNTDVVSFLAHEFHHFYIGKINQHKPADKDSASVLIKVIRQLQLEGIADFIDKEKVIENNGKGMPSAAWKIYSTHYFNPNKNFMKADSILSYTFKHPGSFTGNSKKVQSLFPLGGHPHGHYMAKVILENQGKEGILATIDNPFGFLKSYNSIASEDSTLFNFSEASMMLLSQLEENYLN